MSTLNPTASIFTVLEKIGFSAHEIAVYAAGLAIGSRPASIIAERAGLKRGHTYNILNSLKQKGIVQEYEKNSVRHFTFSSPNSLLSLVQTKEDELEQQKKELLSVIPELERLRNPLSAQPRVRFFQGFEGIKEIFEELLRTTDDELISMVDCNNSWSSSEEGIKWAQGFIRRREAKNVTWRGITVKSHIADHTLDVRPSALRQVKMLEGCELPAEISIAGSKVAICSTSKEMVGVVIENEPIADTLRVIFNLLWSQLPEYEAVAPQAKAA